MHEGMHVRRCKPTVLAHMHTHTHKHKAYMNEAVRTLMYVCIQKYKYPMHILT